MNESFDALQFLGRFHPVLVHLPIGLIVLLVILEGLARTRRFAHAACNSGYLLAIAIPTSAATALLGWFLSRSGEYDSQLVSWHLWTGIATFLLCLVAGLLFKTGRRAAYQAVLVLTFIMLLVASHLGGSLTHGRDYLVEHAPRPIKTWFSKPRAQDSAPDASGWAGKPVFALAVQPVLDQYCVSCHGPEKSKGKLRLDSFEALMRGGDSGPSVVAGNSAQSLLVKRLKLPLDTDEHMPPDGKPQPKPDDIALLEWWINSGAKTEPLAGETPGGDQITALLNSRFGGAPAPTIAPAASEPPADVFSEANAAAAQLGIVVSRLSATEPWLSFNASVVGTNFSDAGLEKLLEFGRNIRILDLSGTAITDSALVMMSGMPHLTRLYLSNTAITDAGLTHLKKAEELEYLNLYGTGVTDAGLELLKDLPKLNRLYLWQTRVSAKAASEWAQAKTDATQIARLREQVKQLENQIAASKVVVELGTPAPSSGGDPLARPVNQTCPVSGKPVDPARTVIHEARVVAFCCDDCKAQFQQNPVQFIAKLPPAAANKSDEKTNTK